MPTATTIKGISLPSVRTADAALVGQAYAQRIILGSRLKDVFGQFEGREGSGRPVVVKTDLTKTRGDTINMSVAGTLGGRGVRGSNRLKGQEEHPRLGNFTVRIDQLRHAVGYCELITKMMAAGESLESSYAKLLADWFGLRKQEDKLMCFIHAANGLNTIRPGNRSSRGALTSGDVFTAGFIDEIKSLGVSRMARPANISKATRKDENEILNYVLFGPDPVLASLRGDDDYLNAMTHAQERGIANTIFRGGYVPWNGVSVFHWDQGDEDTDGAIGSPFLPRALLGDAIEAGTTAIDITGSGRTVSDLGDEAEYFMPFIWFPGAAYEFLSYVSADRTDGSGPHYLAIKNISGADAGKYCIYEYTTGNNGNKITITKRLAPVATGGVAVDVLAGKSWNGDVHTQAHPTGSLIVPITDDALTFGRAVLMGEMALCVGFGDTPMQQIKDQDDYGELRGMGLKSIYGQNAAKDTQGQPRNFVLVEAVCNQPGIGELA
jgi:N4-gp56 family major capsid protein